MSFASLYALITPMTQLLQHNKLTSTSLSSCIMTSNQLRRSNMKLECAQRVHTSNISVENKVILAS